MSVQNKKTPKRQSVGPGTPKQSACEWKPCRTCDAVFPARDFAKHVSSCNQDGGVQNSTCFIKGGKLFAVAEDVQDHSCIHHLPPNEVSNLVLVNPAALQRCQISIGSSVLLETSERIYAAVLTAWPCHHLSPTSIALPGNRTILLNLLAGHSVTVAEFTPTGESASEVFLEILSEAQESLLEPLISRFLDQFNFRYLNVGMKLFLRYLGNNVRVVVRDIKGPAKNLEDSLASLSVGDIADYKMVCSDTQVKFLNFQREAQNENMLKLDDIGGLESAKTELKKLVSRVLNHKDGGYLVRGVLLHGPSGCGKTILAKAVAAEHNLTLINVVGSELYSKFYGETETKLKERFEEAVRRAPSLLLFDDVDTVCGRRDDSSATSDQERRVLSTFIGSLDELGNSNTKCFLIATTNRLDSLDSAVRGPRRLDREIEITVPSSLERSDILRKKVTKMKTNLTDEDVRKIGTVTHGFVGSDIDALLAEAHMSASKRGGEIDMVHVSSALKKVKPSALREVQVEVPNVKWSDVGGQDKLKEKLKQAVEWPIKHAETLKRLGISSPKGLLMYGPPGCSKTLIAKALATESGLNFIAVKSSDLFSKYVGDSEKAVRDVFRRARQVAPSIIFFDEIDALATNRSGGSSQGISVNDRVLAQLLTEMDGVTALNDVQIIAATNRPDMIDKALMRPGRLDRVVYVPLPEKETRLAIFTLMLRKMAVSKDVSVEKLVEKTDMYSGAEVCAVCQEAGLLCLEEDINATIIDERHFDLALQIVRPRTTPDSIIFYEKFSCERGFSKI